MDDDVEREVVVCDLANCVVTGLELARHHQRHPFIGDARAGEVVETAEHDPDQMVGEDGPAQDFGLVEAGAGTHGVRVAGWEQGSVVAVLAKLSAHSAMVSGMTNSQLLWSPAAASLWGKSCREDPATWLPLVQHLTDTTAIAGHLWDSWLPAHVKQRIESGLPAKAREGRVLVRWLAGIHDVGKSSPSFASQVPDLADRMRVFGATLPAVRTSEHRMAAHTVVGQIALEQWLKDEYDVKPRQRMTFGSVVGAHHGMPQTKATIDAVRRRPDLLGEGVWADTRTEILGNISWATGATDLLPSWGSVGIDVPTQMLVTGIVIVADWIASDESRFPYRDQPADSTERAARAWEELHLPPAWKPIATTRGASQLFTDRFPALGSSVRPLQSACYNIASSVQEPCLMILEAPMGQGKTEAALIAAEVLAERFGLGGVFFGLPSMATSNAVFNRVLDWIGQLPGEGATSTFLAHSKAELNEEYAGLVREAQIREVYDEADQTSRDTVVAVVESWLQGRKKGVLANFVVGTIDQALFAALSSKHLMLRHLALVGKIVVIDEVHAADDFMRVYLTRVLEWLAAYQVPVVLLSATLPSAQRHELMAAYLRGAGVDLPSADISIGYPTITVASPSEVGSHAIEGPMDVTRMTVQPLDDDLGTLMRLLDKSLSDGGCAAVIRNTVDRAQQAYLRLAEHFGAGQVVLVHSRFLASDRAIREAGLRHRLGRSGEDRPHRLIVVGTQVLEQSLDVDFDLMISDIAPIDLLLQRSGRLHRHKRTRPLGLEAPRMHLTGLVAWCDDGPVFDRGCSAVYHESRLLRACIALGLGRPENTVAAEIPADIRGLVEAGYDPDLAPPPEWSARLDRADLTLSQELADARKRARGYCLKEVPGVGAELHEPYSLATETNEDRQGGASVRDGDDGLEVLVVQRRDDGIHTMPGILEDSGVQVPEIGCPEPHVAKAIASSSLRLPRAMTGPWAIDRVIDALELSGFANWQQSGWLRGQLVLVLDEDMSADVAGFRLIYDRELGLTVTKEKTQ